nr:hypothetical protein [Streptomyces sp. N2A]
MQEQQQVLAIPSKLANLDMGGEPAVPEALLGIPLDSLETVLQSLCLDTAEFKMPGSFTSLGEEERDVSTQLLFSIGQYGWGRSVKAETQCVVGRLADGFHIDR